MAFDLWVHESSIMDITEKGIKFCEIYRISGYFRLSDHWKTCFIFPNWVILIFAICMFLCGNI